MTSITFHAKHGLNISLSDDRRIAKRLQSSDHALVFTSQPVEVNQKIQVKVTQTTDSWPKSYGTLRLGFTTNDPDELSQEMLPQSIKSNSQGYWWDSLAESGVEFHLNTCVTFWYTAEGHMKVIVSGGDEDTVQRQDLPQFDPTQTHWAVFFVGGSTAEIIIPGAEDDTGNVTQYPDVSTKGWRFTKHAREVQVGNHGKSVKRVCGILDNGVTLLSRPFCVGDTLHFKVTQNVCVRPGSLRFGLTKFMPNEIDIPSLPAKSVPELACREGFLLQYLKLDYSQMNDNAKKPMEINISLTAEGYLYVQINQAAKKVVMVGIDTSVTWWPLIDLAGIPTELCIVDECEYTEPDFNKDVIDFLHMISGNQPVELSRPVPDILVWETLLCMPPEGMSFLADNLFTPWDFQRNLPLARIVKSSLPDGASVGMEAEEFIMNSLRTSVGRLHPLGEMWMLQKIAGESQPESSNSAENLIVLLLRKVANAVVNGHVVQDFDPDDSTQMSMLESIEELEDAGISPLEVKDILDMEIRGLKPVLSDFDETFKKACAYLETGDLKEAESNFAASVRCVQLHSDKLPKEATCFFHMSKIYLMRANNQVTERGNIEGVREDHLELFLKSIGLAQVALNRSNLKSERDELELLIQNIEKCYLKAVKVTLDDEGFNRSRDLTKMMKAKLLDLRENTMSELKTIDEEFGVSMDASEVYSDVMKNAETNRTTSICNIFKKVSESVNCMLQELVTGCICILGQPPCRFALLSLGSLARQEMTPYSDVELAILVEEYGPQRKYISYFRHLSYLMSLKIVTLGETIIPSLAIPSLNDFLKPQGDWFLDSTTVRGFAIDGLMPHACKLPTGRPAIPGVGPEFELICTPKDMLEFQWDSRHPPALHLADTLAKFAVVAGDPALGETYGTMMWEYFMSPNQGPDNHTQPPLSNGRTLALDRLQIDLIKWQPDVTERDNAGKLFHVKKEMYRSPSLLIQNLSMYFEVPFTNTWTALEAMVSNSHLSPEMAHHLATALTIAMEWRMRTYCYHGAQKDAVSSLPHVRPGDSVETSPARMPVTSILRLFYTILPLQETLSEAVDRYKLGDIEDALKTCIPYSSGLKNTVLILNKLQDIDGILHVLEACDDVPKDCIIQSIYAYCLRSRLRSSDAKKIMEEMLEDSRPSDSNYSLVQYLGNMGLCQIEMQHGDFHSALDHARKGLEFAEGRTSGESNNKQVVEAHEIVGTVLRFMGHLGDASDQYKTGMAIQESLTGARPNEDMLIYLYDMCDVVSALGKTNEALTLAMASLAMAKSLYGSGTAHPTLGTILGDVGFLLHLVGRDQEALSCLTQALHVAEICYEGQPHNNVIRAHGQLTNFFFNTGSFTDAKKHIEVMIELINKQPHHEMNYYYAETLIIASYIQANLGKYNDAHSNIAKAKTVYEKCSHRLGFARALIKEALILKDEGNVAVGLVQIQEALTILNDINLAGLTAYIDALSIKASCLMDLGYVSEAILVVEEAMSIANRKQEVGEGYISMELHAEMAELYRLGGQPQTSRLHLTEALKIGKTRFINISTNPHMGVLFEILGNSFASRQLYQKAILAYKLALNIFITVYGADAPVRTIMSAYTNLGYNYMQAGQDLKAYKYLAKSAEICRMMNDTGENVRLLRALHSVYSFMLHIWDIGTAFHMATWILERAQTADPPNPVIIFGVLNNLGNACVNWGEMKPAVQHLEQALGLAQELYHGDHVDKAGVMRNLGRALLTEDGARGMALVTKANEMSRRCDMLLQQSNAVGK